MLFWCLFYLNKNQKIAEMNIEERINQTETRVFKVVFPKITNHHQTMFGGAIMETMVETAFITATRFARKRFVVVACDSSQFKKSIPEHSLVEFVGRVKSVGNTSLKVEVEVFSEEMYEDQRSLSAVGVFSLVALDENKKPMEILEKTT